MRAWLLVCLICLAGAPPAGAGAWLERKGETQLIVTGTYRWNRAGIAQEGGLYATHGFRDRLTLGFDAFTSLGGSGHALVFARLPLGSQDSPRRTALEIALGGHRQSADWAPMLRLSLAHGRGSAKGWFDLAASLEHRAGQPDLAWKLDASLGRSGPARLRPMLQAGIGRTADGVTEWRASAHVLIAARDRQTVVLGLERKRSGTATTAITLALWHRF